MPDIPNFAPRLGNPLWANIFQKKDALLTQAGGDFLRTQLPNGTIEEITRFGATPPDWQPFRSVLPSRRRSHSLESEGEVAVASGMAEEPPDSGRLIQICKQRLYPVPTLVPPTTLNRVLKALEGLWHETSPSERLRQSWLNHIKRPGQGVILQQPPNSYERARHTKNSVSAEALRNTLTRYLGSLEPGGSHAGSWWNRLNHRSQPSPLPFATPVSTTSSSILLDHMGKVLHRSWFVHLPEIDSSFRYSELPNLNHNYRYTIDSDNSRNLHVLYSVGSPQQDSRGVWQNLTLGQFPTMEAPTRLVYTAVAPPGLHPDEFKEAHVTLHPIGE